MADTSVIITTANRPEMLARALRSVRRQTARERITEVVVIENGGVRHSYATCESFADLPIRYVFNAPQRPIKDYLKTTFVESAPRGAYVALLHDDDVWMENHLAQGLDALSEHPAAVACYSGAVVVGNKVRWTPDFGRPDKVELPGWEAPYQEQDDGREAASIWGGV